MNSKLAILASAIITATCVQAAKQLVDGYTWEYTVANGEATVTGVEPASGNATIPSALGGVPVRIIGANAFNHKGIKVSIPFGVTRIESQAFYFSNIEHIPSSVTYIGYFAIAGGRVDKWDMAESVQFDYHTFQNATVDTICASGNVFSDDTLNTIALDGIAKFYCKRQYGKNWVTKFGDAKFAGYIDDMPEVEIVSSAMRKDDPTVMDVVYKVHSSAQTVKVRAMAWENGERNLSKAIRPTKWIEGTEANIGDAVTANEEHKLSWRIAGDWATDLSKVKIEVLAVEDDLLPLELQTIPQTATHQKMKISWNKMTADHVFDALLWLYADGDAGLTLVNGQLKNGANLLASGTSLYNSETAVGYVFGKMGYQKLAGDELAYARRVTQLELPVSGVQQFAVKYPDAQ